VGVAVVPVAGEDPGPARVADLAGLRLLDGLRLTERRELRAAVGVPDLHVTGDVVEVEGAGGQAVPDGDGVVRVDDRIDARQRPLPGHAAAERVDAGQ
jgi:hypothetical protein